ncbi:hypothetical protein EVAR_69536_1 [Eumeta japonica]|uniref:Uncharacterized protein n=1 Tax=Eumeta variegata TaxID=151549 RepID=A0A4C2A5F1_EUMVA|nr:hypothetical protein EVAR_69536_1 [Eumeta japonica]
MEKPFKLGYWPSGKCAVFESKNLDFEFRSLTDDAMINVYLTNLNHSLCAYLDERRRCRTCDAVSASSIIESAPATPHPRRQTSKPLYVPPS